MVDKNTGVDSEGANSTASTDKKENPLIATAKSLGAVAPEKMDKKDLEALVEGLTKKREEEKRQLALHGPLVSVTNTADRPEMKMIGGKEYFFKAKETRKIGLLLATKFFGDKPFTVAK